MLRRLSIASTFRTTGSTNKVKYCKNRGVARKTGRKVKGVIGADDDEDEDDLEQGEMDSFNGVKVIGGGYSGTGGGGGHLHSCLSPSSYSSSQHHASYNHPSSSSPPINIMKIGQGQVTYGGKEGPTSSTGIGKKGDLERNGPRVIPGIITSSGRGNDKVARVFSSQSTSLQNHRGVSIEGKGDNETNKYNDNDDDEHDESNNKNSEIKPIIIPTISGSTLINKKTTEDEESVYLSRKRREMRKKEIKRDFDRSDDRLGSSGVSGKRGVGPGGSSGKGWSFVFDPAGRLCYYWSMIVSLAFLYNFWVIIYRFAFNEISSETMVLWLTFDILSDTVYILDILINFRICYLDEGVLQTNANKLRQYYMNSTFFYIDCLCLLPLDFLYLSIGFNSILRGFRLVKIYKWWSFLDRTERHTNYPNVFRTVSLVHYILVIFHWNACFYHLLSKRNNFGSSDWFLGSRDHQLCPDVECDYLHAFYWSILALTIIGDLPRPRTKGEYIFLIVELFLGLFLLATVLGHVANIVTNVSAARKEFQAKLDSVKTYMRMRRVPEHLKVKVIKWFDYLWMTQKSADEEKSVGFLPAKLKAEIAIHVHLDTLKRVEIFQNTEAGFLCALVLRLRPVLFSPGDYVCRKGEVGKEMYIVNRGKLQVVSDSGANVLAILRAGSYFGEISILNMGTAGNRRTASVKSVGYSDLFCLSKQDLWDVLKDYPAARVRLEAIASKRLEKYKKEPLLKISRGRSKSTPGIQSKYNLNLPKANDGKYSRNHTQSANTLLTDDELLVINEEKSHEEGENGTRRGQDENDDDLGDRGGDGEAHGVGDELDRHSDHQHSLLPPSYHLHQQQSSSGLSDGIKTELNNCNSQASVAFIKEGVNIYFTPPTPTPLTTANLDWLIDGSSISPSVATTTTSKRSPEGEPSNADSNQGIVPRPNQLRPSASPTPPFNSSNSPSHSHSHCNVPSSTSTSNTYHHHHHPFACHLISPAHSTSHLFLSTASGTPLVPLSPVPSFGESEASSAVNAALSAAAATTSAGNLPPQEILLSEIKRLRDRLAHLEKENTSMSYKLSQQQWEVEERLKGIEMKMIATKEDDASSCGNRIFNDDRLIVGCENDDEDDGEGYNGELVLCGETGFESSGPEEEDGLCRCPEDEDGVDHGVNVDNDIDDDEDESERNKESII
ncbi:cGMP-gated cation channel alpha-1-like isoform X2 [Tetranychus urticae]|uniref:Cyclic nucleotide-binding domain-containing protein n=1 Tax=Tetranychus urticae TaxID=32264 RepID=T1KZI2_TETUR|nr:cGMP-gated cation channel alpha-1-like isoform X2 [Tetranychus urticae]